MSQNWRVGLTRHLARRSAGRWHAPVSDGLPRNHLVTLTRGEKLMTPVAICTRGGRAALFRGWASLLYIGPAGGYR